MRRHRSTWVISRGRKSQKSHPSVWLQHLDLTMNEWSREQLRFSFVSQHKFSSARHVLRMAYYEARARLLLLSLGLCLTDDQFRRTAGQHLLFLSSHDFCLFKLLFINVGEFHLFFHFQEKVDFFLKKEKKERKEREEA